LKTSDKNLKKIDNWEEERMEGAIEEYKEGRLGIRQPQLAQPQVAQPQVAQSAMALTLKKLPPPEVPPCEPSTSGTAHVPLDVIYSKPARQRSLGKRREKPPSINLTSEEHFSFLEKKQKKNTKSGKSSSVKPNSKRKPTPKSRNQTKKGKNKVHKCKVCKFIFRDKNDPKSDEDWVTCTICQNDVWLHESCAEEIGILGDDGFICFECV
jgi:hypothetical protein